VVTKGDGFLGHAKDDWINVGRAMAVPLDDVIARLREGRHDLA
jgi:hydroxylysine kinase